MDWTDEAARAMERLTGDPLGDAVPGVAEIVAISEPTRRRRYQVAQIRLLVEAPGMEPTFVDTEVVLDRRVWPAPGVRLPAQVPIRVPDRTQVVWDALAR